LFVAVLLIVGALVTWAMYKQGQLLLWWSLIIKGVVPGLGWVYTAQVTTSPRKPSSCNHGEEICHDPCHAKLIAIAAGHELPLNHRALTVPRYQVLSVLNRLFLYSCSKAEHPPVGHHSCTTGNRSRNLCYDSWSLSHLGYLYPETTPVMIKLDHNRSCPWV